MLPPRPARPRSGVPALASLLAIALALAGCLGPDEAPPVEPADTSLVREAAPAANQTGALEVLARMPDLSLLPGVRVSVGEREATTDAEGIARFAELPPGEHNVTARKEAHRTAQLVATVAAGETSRVVVELPAEGADQHAHEGGVFAHRDLYRFEGHFQCSATYVIITGDCFVLVDNVTSTAGLGTAAGDTTSERYLIDFPLDASWTGLVVEMAWSTNVSSEATGDGMTLALEPAEAPADGHAVKYARASGGSPLRLDLAPGVKHATATASDMPNPAGGEVIRARAYVQGAAHDAGGQGYLGAGATVDHSFVLYVSIFYGDAPPAEYTALEGA